MSGSDRRIYGLDVFRSFAVLFVVTGHTLEHSTIPDVVRRLGSIGGLGVEMFFVLSGFLIGGILLNLIDAGRLHSPSDLRGFWARRWLRTLPMYVVAMIAFLRFDYLGRHSLTDYLPYWIFMQNFAWPISKFFGLSWSLAIEEHFYLWFPMIFLAIHSFVRVNYTSVVLSCLVMALVSILYRLSLPFFTDFNEFNYHSRMVVLAHLDGIAAGVAVAVIQRKAIGVFKAIGSLFPIWMVMTTAIISWYLVGLPGLMASRGVQIFVLTGKSIVFALLIPVVLHAAERGEFNFGPVLSVHQQDFLLDVSHAYPGDHFREQISRAVGSVRPGLQPADRFISRLFCRIFCSVVADL